MHQVLRSSISLLTLVVFMSSSMNIKSHSNQELNRQINSLIENCLKKIEPPSPINFIIDSEVDSIFLEYILSSYRATYATILNDFEDRSSRCNLTICKKVYSIVGVFKTPQNVEVDKWSEFYGLTVWDPLIPITIWITGQAHANDVEELLKTFWRLSSIDVIAIAINALDDTTTVFSYNPFVMKSDGNRGEMFEIASGDDFFPDKLQNLQGFLIPISLYKNEPYATLNNSTELIDGSDVNFCKTLSNWMNFTIDLKTASVDYGSYVVKLPNGSESSDVGDIVTNRSDMLGNSMHWELNDWIEVDYAYPYWRSKVVVIVPRNKPLPGISHLFKSGSGVTMALTFGALCLLFFILSIKGDSYALLSTFGLLLHQTFRKIGKQDSERIFCIAWIYWSLVLISSFQGKLVHDIAAPPYHNDMNSLKALVKSNLTLMSRAWERNILNNSSSNITKQLYHKSIIEMNSSNCGMKMIKHENVACAVDGYHADFIIGQVKRAIYYMRKSNRKLVVSRDIHVMKEPLFHYWRTYIVKKHFVYLRKINKLSARLVEFGIIEKWSRDDLAKNLQMQFINNDPEPLDFQKTQNVFIILVCGDFIATCFLLIEIVFHKLQSQMKGN